MTPTGSAPSRGDIRPRQNGLMPFAFACGGCRRVLLADEAQDGTSVLCPTCGHDLFVPYPEGVTASADTEPQISEHITVAEAIRPRAAEVHLTVEPPSRPVPVTPWEGPDATEETFAAAERSAWEQIVLGLGWVRVAIIAWLGVLGLSAVALVAFLLLSREAAQAGPGSVWVIEVLSLGAGVVCLFGLTWGRRLCLRVPRSSSLRGLVGVSALATAFGVVFGGGACLAACLAQLGEGVPGTLVAAVGLAWLAAPFTIVGEVAFLVFLGGLGKHLPSPALRRGVLRLWVVIALAAAVLVAVSVVSGLAALIPGPGNPASPTRALLFVFSLAVALAALAVVGFAYLGVLKTAQESIAARFGGALRRRP